MISHQTLRPKHFMEDEMRASSTNKFVVTLLAFALFLCSGMRASAQTRVSVGVTETIETPNPYGDSVSLLYGIFSEVTGPFCTYSYAKGDFEGRLAERWKVENPTTWIFYLSRSEEHTSELQSRPHLVCR